MKPKYNVGDIIVAPHYNGHNLPAVLTIIKREPNKKIPNLLSYTMLCSDEKVGKIILIQEDIDYYVSEGEYIHYPVKK